MATTARSLRWRVIDIVTAAVLGVACGLIFVAWNQVGYAGYEAFKAILPGLNGLVTGVWLLGGTLGGQTPVASPSRPGVMALRASRAAVPT